MRPDAGLKATTGGPRPAVVAQPPGEAAWQKRGCLFCVHDRHDWMFSHAQLPTADRVDSETLRVYFGTRDRANRTRTTYVDLDAARPECVRHVPERPVLEPGALGCFDDCGVMPSSVVETSGVRYLYYIGWNTSTTVPYRNSIGLAVSEDGGRSFRRAFDGPILDRTRSEPHFCSTPCVLTEGRLWRMWYLSCVAWEPVRGRPEPKYHVKYAESHNGVDWHRDGVVCIDFADADESIGRPWVIRTGGLYRMWYCHRRIDGYRTRRECSYRIGYAESTDGVQWTRLDGRAGIDVSAGGWDSEMIAYPCVDAEGDRLRLFYNGNGFGQSGFGLAVRPEPARAVDEIER